HRRLRHHQHSGGWRMSDLVAAARKYLNVPFKHRGRTEAGLDCLGLVVLAFRDIGVDVGDARNYGRRPEPDHDRLRAALVERFGPPVRALQVGDIVTMRWYKQVNHIAIVTDYPYGGFGLIHSLVSVKRVV